MPSCNGRHTLVNCVFILFYQSCHACWATTQQNFSCSNGWKMALGVCWIQAKSQHFVVQCTLISHTVSHKMCTDQSHRVVKCALI